MTDAAVAPLVGAWIEYLLQGIQAQEHIVAPLVGAWIEIIESAERLSLRLSLLSWERGLKLMICHEKVVISVVAPLVGAWIEIINRFSCTELLVAPLVERG